MRELQTLEEELREAVERRRVAWEAKVSASLALGTGPAPPSGNRRPEGALDLLNPTVASD